MCLFFLILFALGVGAEGPVPETETRSHLHHASSQGRNGPADPKYVKPPRRGGWLVRPLSQPPNATSMKGQHHANGSS